MTEECKKDIIEYVDSKGYVCNTGRGWMLFDSNGMFCRGYYMFSEKGDNIKYKDYCPNYPNDNVVFDRLDKYFLEFIGNILRKHKVKKVIFYDDPGKGTIYTSYSWKYDEILTNKLNYL